MESTRLYSTGVYLIPTQTMSGSWAWIVESFEDDTYGTDGEAVNYPATATSREYLLKQTTGEETLAAW